MPLQRLNRRSHPGFTMIELLTVIAIIGIISGIFVVGYKHVGVKAQERQTRTSLERLKNVIAGATRNAAADKAFFEIAIPAIYRDPADTNADVFARRTWDAVPAGSADALYYTKVVLEKLRANGEANAALADVPTDQQGTFYFRNSDHALVDAADTSRKEKAILPLDAWRKPMLFVYDHWQVPQDTGVSNPRLTGGSGATAGLPTGGLTDLYSDAGKQYWQFNPRVPVREAPIAYAYAVAMTASSPNRTTYARAGNAFHSPDNRPFWVSAGPDGKFETHDDNVYSFEN